MHPEITPVDRFGMTLFVALIAHAVVILGVVFKPTEKQQIQTNTLDVVLVQQKSDTTPEEYEFLAQASQDGGGESEARERPASPLPSPLTAPKANVVSATPPPKPLVARAPSSPESSPTPEQGGSKPLLAQTKTDSTKKTSKPSQPDPQNKQKNRREKAASNTPQPPTQVRTKQTPELPRQSTPTQTLTASSLVTNSLAMASLSAELDQRLNAYAKRPKRKWISVRTREYKYASYMEAWRAKVERVGNLNYPEQARRKKLSGSLLLEVALNPDGSINKILLRRSSGYRVLDDAAIRIVKLSAPFAPFPKNILQETDILHIERTWRFLSSNQFASR